MSRLPDSLGVLRDDLSIPIGPWPRIGRPAKHEYIAELNKRAAEADLRLKRLNDAIETGVADLSDSTLKERTASLTAVRD